MDFPDEFRVHSHGTACDTLGRHEAQQQSSDMQAYETICKSLPCLLGKQGTRHIFDVLLGWYMIASEEGDLSMTLQDHDRALQMTKGSPVAVLLGWKLPLASHLCVSSKDLSMLRMCACHS